MGCSCCNCFYRWSLIAGRLPGRTDNEIKNYWNTHIRRKLLIRGIDPSTHLAINEPPTVATTISFSTPKEEEKFTDGFNTKDEKNPVRERCPDLNLELRISPPYQHQHQHEPLRTGNSLCFSCSLGVESSKGCGCSANGTGSSKAGYNFLGMKSGVLDYRSLEMKWGLSYVENREISKRLVFG